MPEGRMLKKVISTSLKIAKLKSDSARLLYTWLIPHLDIEGRFSADPNIVKGYVVPRLRMSSRKIAEYLEDMANNNLIILYEVNGDKFLELNKFKDFQILREKRESKSLIPAPTPGELQENSSTSKVKESKVKESKVKIKFLDFVLLTEEEHKKLLDKLGKNRTEDMIEKLNNYIGSHGKKYKSHYFTILSWDRKDPDKKPIRKTKFFKAEENEGEFMPIPKGFANQIKQDMKKIEDKKKAFNG